MNITVQFFLYTVSNLGYPLISLPLLAYVEQTENAATGAASIIVNDTGKI